MTIWQLDHIFFSIFEPFSHFKLGLLYIYGYIFKDLFMSSPLTPNGVLLINSQHCFRQRKCGKNLKKQTKQKGKQKTQWDSNRGAGGLAGYRLMGKVGKGWGVGGGHGGALTSQGHIYNRNDKRVVAKVAEENGVWGGVHLHRSTGRNRLKGKKNK